MLVEVPLKKHLPFSPKCSFLGTTYFWLRVFNQYLSHLTTRTRASIKLFYRSLYQYKNNGILEPKSCAQKHSAFSWSLLVSYDTVKKNQWWYAVLPMGNSFASSFTEHCFGVPLHSSLLVHYLGEKYSWPTPTKIADNYRNSKRTPWKSNTSVL